MDSIYLTSPLGFSEAGALFKDQRLVPLIKGAGFSVIDPWQSDKGIRIAEAQGIGAENLRRSRLYEINNSIAQDNIAGIIRSDAMVAVLDGPDIDSGTAWEMGFAYGLWHHGKSYRIIGYRSDFRRSGDNDGSVVNLQAEFPIYETGGMIAGSLRELGKELMTLKKYLKQAT